MWTRRSSRRQVFSGLRQKKTSLPEETIQFFEFDLPDRLSNVDKEYLTQLKESKSHKEPRDDDRDFFEANAEKYLSRQRPTRSNIERTANRRASASRSA